MLRNISRKATELSLNPDVTLNPYLSQAAKQFKQIYIPEVTIRPAANDGAEKSHSEIGSPFASPTLSKKSKRLPKKYSQLNRTATTPRFSSVEESKSDGKSVRVKESSAPAFKIFNGKPRNGSLSAPPSNVHSGSIEKPKSQREWNVQGSFIQAKPQLTSRLNNSNNIVNLNYLKSLNISKNVQLPSRYNIVPRPFAALQSPSPLVVTTNVDASYRKPSLSPTGFGHQIARSSANVLPLVLPTDLFNPSPTRRYVPIKRTNHFNLEGNSATIVSTEASPPTSPVGERTTLADYNAVYSAVIGATKNPLVTVSSQQSYSPPDYYGITESPAERAVTKTNFATYVPSQTSASYNVQQRKDSQAIHDFLPRTSGYNNPDDEKSSLNENPGIALYNKFASLYSTNVPNVFSAPKAITQDFKQPPQQQVLALPRATLTPLTPILTPTLLKVRPIISSKPAPYYDSRLLVSQDGKYNANNAEDDEVNEQPRAEDADKTEKEDNDSDDNDEIGKYKTEINRKVYKVYKTPKTQREDREEEEEDRHPQQSRNYQDKDKHRKYDESDEGSKSDDRPEKYESDDDEEVEETEEEEYVGKNEDEDNDAPRRQYNKYEYDRNSDEKQGEKPRYDHKKDNEPKDRRDKHDYGSDVEHRFENNNKYLESLYNGDDDEIRERSKEYRDRSDKKKLAGDNRYKKHRQDREYEESEDESAAEDKPFTQHSKTQRAYKQNKIYEVEQSDNGDKRKYRYQVSPRKDSLREKQPREEYSETNPTHTREEYRPQRVENDHPRHESGNQDDDKGEGQDHVHGETQEHAETHKHEEHHGKKKGGDHKFEKGGGEEHEEEHHGHKGEKGDKVNCYLHYVPFKYRACFTLFSFDT